MRLIKNAIGLLINNSTQLLHLTVAFMAITFILGVAIDGFFQIKHTHTWKPTDWEITMWTTALAANGIFVLKGKK